MGSGWCGEAGRLMCFILLNLYLCLPKICITVLSMGWFARCEEQTPSWPPPHQQERASSRVLNPNDATVECKIYTVIRHALPLVHTV